MCSSFKRTNFYSHAKKETSPKNKQNVIFTPELYPCSIIYALGQKKKLNCLPLASKECLNLYRHANIIVTCGEVYQEKIIQEFNTMVQNIYYINHEKKAEHSLLPRYVFFGHALLLSIG